MTSRTSARAYYANLNRLLAGHDVSMAAKHLGERLDTTDGNWPHDLWQCTFRMDGRKATFEYRAGLGHEGKRPVEGAVLECLLLDTDSIEEPFDEWCSNFGFDSDSRKAEQMYLACQRTAEQMENLFGGPFLRRMRAALDEDNG